MRTEELKKLRKLNATPAMIKKAAEDHPVPKLVGWSNRKQDSYKYGVYIRAQYLQGYLKVVFFLADLMRTGDVTPRYELYINDQTGEFVTWDCEKRQWRNAKIDMLDWPEYKYHSGTYSNNDTNSNIKNYLKVENGGLKGILDFQLSQRAAELKKRHRRETDPWDRMQEQVPELPKDWGRWVDKQGVTENYIFYDYKKGGNTKGFCTYCEKMVDVKNPKYNQAGKCSCCGKKVIFKSNVKAGPTVLTESHTCWIIQNCEIGFVMRGFSARKKFIKPAERPGQVSSELYISEHTRVFYNDRLSGDTYTYGFYKNVETRWIKGYDRSSYGYYYGSYYKNPGNIYSRNLNSISLLKKTGLIECARGIGKIDPDHCLGVLRNKPYLEKVIKIGLVNLASELVNGKTISQLEDSKDFAKALMIDKYRLKRLRSIDGGLIALEWLKYEKRLEVREIDDDVIKFFDRENIKPKDITFMTDRMSERRICNYLKKQTRLSGRIVKELISTWEDYLNMAKRLKMETSSELIFKPKNLKEAHDSVLNLCGEKGLTLKAVEIAADYPNVDSICESIKSKYEFETKEFKLIIPERIEDILKEGEILRLCFDRDDRYFDRINRRETYLGFLRTQQDPDKPHYVLEFEPNGTVRQKRTLGDNQNEDIEDAKKFILRWQKEILKKLSKEDEILGTESVKLRIQNFNELRESKTKVRSGHLAGQYLLDILENDLMDIRNVI